MFIDDLIINAKNRWYLEKESGDLEKESGTSRMEQSDSGTRTYRLESGDHLVEVLGTVIIAMLLLVLFRNQIADAFATNLEEVHDQLDGLFAGWGT